jgi:hypothetical protein
MTAEIAIANQRGVALAADSAITVGTGGGEKIFQTAEKLYSLSKYRPVGIMIYNQANFMGIHWETIIKLYRQTLAEASFPTLQEFANHFLSYLQSNRALFPLEQQQTFVRGRLLSAFEEIKEKAMAEVYRRIRESETPAPDLAEQALDDVVDANYEVAKQQASPFKDFESEPIAPVATEEIIGKYSEDISEMKELVFKGLPVSAANSRKLRIIGESILTKDLDTDAYSGIVIAGFGDAEFFPHLVSFHLEGIVDNHLKCAVQQDYAVTFNNRAAIFPFAQSEVVLNFLRGIDPAYYGLVKSEIETKLGTFAEAIVGRYFQSADSQQIARNIRSLVKSLVDDSAEKLERVQRERFVDPILDIVVSLPKPELASMAESLVNLTSLRRRMSTDAENVGGPIDVALITKGDGFVWIKRKHYFDASLNHRYFENYFRGTKNEESENSEC